MAVQSTQTILAFFEFLFGSDEGYAAIATTRPPAKRDTFKERFFGWPNEKDELVAYIDHAIPGNNVYFCVNLFDAPRRKKDNAIPQNLVWADLDLCPPEDVIIPPQCVIESSPNKYQAIWRLEEKIDPRVAENYSKRIAYSHPDIDKSGHDITQLLRVPSSYNFKYELAVAPRVELLSMIDMLLPVSLFDDLPQPTVVDAVAYDTDVPDVANLPTPEMIIYRHREELEPTPFHTYYTVEPESDWSSAMWRLLMLCVHVGMTDEEIFVIALNSNCNKYERDNRPTYELWREIKKARLDSDAHVTTFEYAPSLEMPQLLTDEEEVSLPTTIMNDYQAWAESVTDATPIYHELSCAIALSSLMATTLRLNTSHSKIVPNLYGMVLGDSSLTRKTTAMDMAIELLLEVQDTILIGSDASPEGLLHNLSLRPRMVSLFYRDEVAGLWDSMRRKEYMASLPEILTKMYDVPKYYTRMLRKESFSVSEPIFVMLCGGIPERMFGLIDEEQITSGFLPRFLVVRGHSDSSKIKSTGPPQIADTSARQDILQTFRAFYSMYTDQQVIIEMADGQKLAVVPDIEAVVDDDVWKRSAIMEKQLMDVAANSPEPYKALPTFTRMFVSLLKLTMLISATRQEPEGLKFKITLDDLLCAASYIQRWGVFSIDLINQAGLTADETKLQAVYRTISKHPGMMRADLLSWHKLSARDLTLIEQTLIERMMINVQKKGKGRAYWPVGQ